MLVDMLLNAYGSEKENNIFIDWSFIMTPESIKQQCLDLYSAGAKPKQIYEDVYSKHHTGTLETFARLLRKWRNKEKTANKEILNAGTFEGFTAHNATVQVDKDGKITQAWVKQQAESVDWDEVIDNFIEKVEPEHYDSIKTSTDYMLEIPLFDLHFGIADFDTYKDLQREIVNFIQSKDWDEINILIGQDLLHTNDMRGHTSKGTEIGVIDFPKAWNDAWKFWCDIIRQSLQHSKHTKIRYSKGNHDECSAWCFLKALEGKFPDAEVDDSLYPRKVIAWRDCFIGYGHCEYTNKNGELFKQFIMNYPKEYAEAKVREVHTGHLHHESIDSGFMLRRLSTGAPETKWENENGYVTAHRRFQLFEWIPGNLKSIQYISIN